MQASKGELFDDAEFKAGKSGKNRFQFLQSLADELDDMIRNSGTKVNQTTLDTVIAVLRKAQAADMTVEAFAQELWEKLSDFEPWRARLWARTESAKVDNWANLEGYKQTEFVDRKGWMCSFVPESRESHIAADEQEVGVNEDFMIGGEAMSYPGDPRGDAGNVVNCLCSVYPIAGD